jgi:CHAD domain-containing protein
MRARAEVLSLEDLEPDAVHDRRVASRRLRVACALFGPLLPEARRSAKRLKAFSAALGGLRELDVHRASLLLLRSQAHEPLEQAALEHTLEWVEARRRKSRDKAEAQLGGKEPKGLTRDVAELAEQLEAHAGPESTATFAWDALAPRTAEAFGALEGHRAAEEPAAMHGTRTRLKQLRYALEYLEPAFLEGTGPFQELTKGLQDALGHHHDAVLLVELMADHQAKLAARGRTVLVGGLQQAIRRAEARRRDLYRAFQAAVPATPVAALSQSLWVALDPLQGRWISS